MGNILITGRTDTGRVRQNNEDFIQFDEHYQLAVLADGVGGAEAGEIASEMAVKTVMDSIKKYSHDTNPDSSVITGAIKEANREVLEVSRNNPKYQGMGTTIVVVQFNGNTYTVAHVGDSRLYQLRNGRLMQLTKDHSVIQELIDEGYYSSVDDIGADYPNAITRALGIGEEVLIDISTYETEANDLLLLCSDGLTDMLNNEQIENTLKTYNNNLDKASDILVEMANENGGKDNISVVLMKNDHD